MMFGGQTVMMGMALRIDLPGHAIRLCEGAEIYFNGDRYTSSDDVFGIITAVDTFASGEADKAPSLEFTWGVKDRAAAVALSKPAIQKSPVQWSWLKIDRDRNAVLGSYSAFTGIVDYSDISGDKGVFNLRMGITTELDRLLNTDKGNRLNRAFHRSVHPTEAGLDLMTGTVIPGAWGEEDQARRSQGGCGGGGTRGGGGRISYR